MIYGRYCSWRQASCSELMRNCVEGNLSEDAKGAGSGLVTVVPWGFFTVSAQWSPRGSALLRSYLEEEVVWLSLRWSFPRLSHRSLDVSPHLCLGSCGAGLWLLERSYGETIWSHKLEGFSYTVYIWLQLPLNTSLLISTVYFSLSLFFYMQMFVAVVLQSLFFFSLSLFAGVGADLGFCLICIILSFLYSFFL